MHTPFVLFLGDLGGGEIMLIMVVILIFFGANKIPELARGLGKGIREFKDASTEIRKEFEGHGLPNQAGPAAQPPYAAPVLAAPAYAALPGEPGHVAPAEYPAAASVPTVAVVAPLPASPVAEVAEVAAEPLPPMQPMPSALPPNLAPEGTQPRQPFVPAAPQE